MINCKYCKHYDNEIKKAKQLKKEHLEGFH